jgi:hypothetical protein
VFTGQTHGISLNEKLKALKNIGDYDWDYKN